MRTRFSSIKIILLFCCLLDPGKGNSQKPYFPFQHFSSTDGLSQNQVLSIFQDQKGFMWFGTLEGLNRFDGYEFKVYHHQNNDSTSLSHDFVTSIFEDHQGTLWVGTSEGLSRYNRAKDSFESYIHNPQQKNSISPGLINKMVEDKIGNFWIAFASGYVDYFDRKGSEFLHYSINKNLADITSLLEDADGNLWIGSQAGITIMNRSHQMVNRFQHQPQEPASLSNDNVNAILQDADRVIWIATDDGLNKYNPIDKNFVHFLHYNNNLGTLRLKCMSQDKQGRLWIGMENGGLDIWDRTKNEVYHLKQNESDKRAISDNSVYSIYRDKNDNMWVGTNSQGVNFYDVHRKPFVIYQNIPGQSDCLSHNKVNAVAEQPNKGFWIATDGGGLNFFDEKNGTFTAFTHKPDDVRSIPSDYVVDVLWDASDQLLWVATWGGGLASFDPSSEKFTRYQHRENDLTSLASNNLWRIYQDQDGLLYIGTIGKGLSVYNKSLSVFYNYGPANGLSEENVVSIFRDSRDKLWLGTWGNGVSCMDISKKIFTPAPSIVTIKSCESIEGDKMGRIWILGNPGIQCYDPKKNSVFSLTTEDGLPRSNINGMVEDKRGKIWLSTNKGIVEFNLLQGHPRIFSVEDGLPTNQFTGRLLHATNGKMYFGSVDGLVVFHPDSIKQNLILPTVIITDLKVFNKSIVVGAKDSVLRQNISETREIWLPYEFNFISLSFAALSYTSPQRNQYAYQLKGFDPDWVLADKQRSVTFTSLDPGDYEFKVKASNDDGLWNEKYTTLLIHVLPPWWQTYWFRAFGISLLGLSATAFYRFRLRSVEKQNERLSMVVKQRTRELEEMNEEVTEKNEKLQERQEEIETQNEELKLSQEEISSQRDTMLAQNQKLEEAQAIIERQNVQTKLRNENLEIEIQSRTKELLEYNQQLEQFAFISAHNLRAPVARILGLGNILDLTSINPEENKMIYKKMVATANELDRVVRDLNTILEIRKNSSTLVSEINLAEELEKVKLYIEKEIEDTKSIVQSDFSKAPVLVSVKPYVESVLHNLLSNAIKYRYPNRPPIIRVATSIVEDYICLMVSDNGLGIDTELFKDKIFNLYQRFHNHVEGKGLGLYLIKTQVQALGGKIEIESKVNEGTLFKVYFKRSR